MPESLKVLRSSSGSLAMLAAMRRASSRRAGPAHPRVNMPLQAVALRIAPAACGLYSI